jgi:hypothetical protein
MYFVKYELFNSVLLKTYLRKVIYKVLAVPQTVHRGYRLQVFYFLSSLASSCVHELIFTYHVFLCK